MKEIWKDIEGFDGYRVSNLGRVYSKKSDIIMSQHTTRKGYKRVGLYRNGQQKKPLVHVLVAEAFLNKPNDNYQVNHEDLDKTNNNVVNLEWVTGSENVNHFIENDEGRREYLSEKMSDIGKKYNRLGIKASKKPVVQLDKDTGEVICVFESARQAAEETGANYRNISQVCNNDKNSHMGYNWEFYN